MTCAGKRLSMITLPRLTVGATHRVIGVRLTRADGKLTAVPLTVRQLGALTRSGSSVPGEAAP